MMKFLRSQSQSVLVLILVVLGGSFIFYGTGNVLSPSGARGSNDYGRIDGQDLSVAELYQAVRNARDELILSGQAERLNQPGTREEIAEEGWRQLLIQREADRLHVEISDQELADYIRGLFQKDGAYSPDLYQKAMNNIENAYHITPDAFEALMRGNLRANAVRQALFSTVRTPGKDVETEYAKYYGPVQLSVITFDPKTFAASAQVTPEQIEAEYKAHPDNPAYRTPEKRKVDYVLFPLTADQAKLPAKDKTAAIEALGEKALDFALAFQPDPSASTNSTPATPPDFQTEAKKRGLTSITTDFFTAESSPAGLPPSPAFNSAAFSLSKDSPVSKVVALDNGVAVLHLSEVQPSDLRPLDQVKADIAKQLQQTQGDQAAQVAAQKAAASLQASLKTGSDFKAAAAALKLTVQTLPSLVPATAPRTDMKLQTLAYASTGLEVNGLSGPVPLDTDNTILLIHLDSRSLPDQAKYAEFDTHFRQAQDERLRNVAYVDWANWKSRQSGTHKPPDLGQYGGVE